MPEEEIWQDFFDPEEIFRKLKITNKVNTIADFGSGYGTFSLKAAQYAETVYALDIDPKMVNHLISKLSPSSNIVVKHCDFMNKALLDDNSIDLVLLFNILHTDSMEDLLDEVNRVLVPDGEIAVIHWNYDETTPRGPPMDIRKKPEEISKYFTKKHMTVLRFVNLPPYHFGYVFTRD